MKVKRAVFALIAVALAMLAHAGEDFDVRYTASFFANASSGDLAPYMIGSWNSGRITSANGVWQGSLLEKAYNRNKRFSWGAGFEYITGNGSGASYGKYSNGAWSTKSVSQASLRIIQLYGSLKYRGTFMLIGMKECNSLIVDNELSSGDLTRSNNATPIAGVTMGFNDFQSVPYTNGWLQIEGEIMYGRFFDNDYRRDSFNYYAGLLSTNNWYTYKSVYFRSKPTQPLCVIFGMQTAGEFAGDAQFYIRGKVDYEYHRPFHLRDIIDMFIPLEGSGEGYYKGSTLGSWDLKTRYRFQNGSELTAYFEGPWEDGSGIGRQNGWDGLYGLQYNFVRGLPISKILFEYFDFTNQSGPIHFAPNDTPGSSIQEGITGGDNYYNNDFYGAYAHYGMSIGSPFVVSPLYNLNGMPGFLHNRARGFHAAIAGTLASQWDYTAKFSYQHAGGTGRVPAIKRLHNTSGLLGINWHGSDKLKGMSVKAQLSFDAGDLRGDNFGALIGITYSGNFAVGRK